eukprot:gene15623-18563_t
MISDNQLSFLANSLGAIAFLLIVLYHYITAVPAVAPHNKRE